MRLAKLSRLIFAVAASMGFTAAFAQISLRDDVDRSIFLMKPATRIVALAPVLAELVFAAGAGEQLVGVSAQTELPPGAKKVQEIDIGSNFSLGQVAALKPDLVLVSPESIRPEDVDRASAAGMTVFLAQTLRLEDVPRLLKTIGTLTGHDMSSMAENYERKLDDLRRSNANKQRLGVFLEIWNRPLTTISGNHFLSGALDVCRADSVFKDWRTPAPQVSLDQVQVRNPYVIVGMGSAANAEEFRANWSLRRALTAVQEGRLVFVNTDANRQPSMRTPDDVAELCAGLDRIRATLREPH